MSQFYNRYLPSDKQSSLSKGAGPANKRKIIEEPHLEGKRKKKARRSPPASDVRQSSQQTQAIGIENSGPPKTSEHGGADSLLNKYRVSKATNHDTGPTEVKVKKQRKKISNGIIKLTTDQSVQPASTDGVIGSEEISNHAEEADYNKRHARILSKYQSSRSKDTQVDKDSTTSETVFREEAPESSVELHGLEPIPQPEQIELPVQKPNYSTLPPWQADPVRVIAGDGPNFDTFPISQTTLKNLKKHGLDKAFPIQSTILSLLLYGKAMYEGDLCISAATGSGKTLAYVLPIIEDLKDMPNTKLRGLVIVPTRELVIQVRQQFELCASGTSLKFGTALGTQSIKNEQENLVQEDEVYDAAEYQQQQETPIDWATFSLEKVIHGVRRQKLQDSAEFITKFRSKVDVLITTPGRLVDHLHNTPGFNLDHVKWLVIDEADRLLNESYQEWIDTVIPALQSQAATKKRDEVLRYMRMEPPKRRIRKVLLSATMTKDISKLNSLGLINPKLVILGSEGGSTQEEQTENDTFEIDEDLKADARGSFYLPATLIESAIPVRDGSEKPLILLRLLEDIAGQGSSGVQKQDRQDSASEETSSDSSTSTTSSSDSDSQSISDSSFTSEQDSEENGSLVQKPPLKLKNKPKIPRALIFTRSTASANRLARLLSLLSPDLSKQISTLTRSTTSSATSRRAFSAFRNSNTSILVGTDRASRGLDIPGLEHVISYDIPSSALTYVHRAGRTARAGQDGHAWTLVEHREGKWFWKEIGGKSKDDDLLKSEVKIHRTQKIKRVNLEVEDDGVKERYAEALRHLGDEVKNG